jgi:ureidoglycolate hydrolase
VTLTVQTITPASFAPFGAVIAWTPELEESGRGFHVVMRSEAPTGWRLAVSKVTARTLDHLAYHPDTAEMFAPAGGCAVLLVAPPGDLDESAITAFCLDCAVSVGPGVWHGLVALSAHATVVIAENLDVEGVSASLSRPIGAELA